MRRKRIKKKSELVYSHRVDKRVLVHHICNIKTQSVTTGLRN